MSVKPKAQTKEDIERELNQTKINARQAYATALGLQLYTQYTPTEAIHIAALLLAGCIGNGAILQEAAVQKVFKEVFARVERDAREVMTARANLKAMLDGDGDAEF